jgi:hypothetical protein
MGCGTGKQGIYNLLLLGAYLHWVKIPRTIVILPRDSLPSMQVMQSHQYLRRTNMTVLSLLPVDVQNQECPTHFDLLFVSIHAYSGLMVGYRSI